MKKKNVKAVIDVMMTALMLLLMAYSLIGEKNHEIIGTVIFVLFLTHHILNRKAMFSVLKGKQSPWRIINTTVNILLFAIMILLPLSGIAMSKHLYTFLPTYSLASLSRTVHLLLSYWGFVLMSFHLGMHMDRWINARMNKSLYRVITALSIILSLYGAYAFVKRGLYEYMFLITQFVFIDLSESVILYIADYAAIAVLFSVFGFFAKKRLKK